MSSQEEKPIIGSRLKMKIKFSNSNEHGQESRNQIPPPAQTPSPPNQSPSSMGKRKKKPKMHDGFISHPGKRISKSISESDHVGSSVGPKLASRKRKPLRNGAHNQDDATTSAMIRAEEVQSTLSSEFPSFTKIMVRAHVINGFWMGVPGNFSKEHLPRTDAPFILVDESGQEFEVKYNGEKMGISAGWRKFSVEQKLLEKDVLIFQLVEPYKFKVYVVRANDVKDVDGALSLLNLKALIKQNDKAKDGGENRQKNQCASTHKRKCINSLQCSNLLPKNKKTNSGKSVPKKFQLANKLEDGYKNTDSSSSCSPCFKTIKSFEDFTIMINGLCIDSELPEDIRAKYYDLCSARNNFLHAHLLEGLNSKLIAGIIWEIVNICDSIRTCSLMTSQDEFENWDKTLQSFELLGMSVGFLGKRVSMLNELAYVSEEALEMKKYVEAKAGRFQAEDEIVNLETKIIELKEASDKYNVDAETLKHKAESYELKFQEVVDAPW